MQALDIKKIVSFTALAGISSATDNCGACVGCTLLVLFVGQFNEKGTTHERIVHPYRSRANKGVSGNTNMLACMNLEIFADR